MRGIKLYHKVDWSMANNRLLHDYNSMTFTDDKPITELDNKVRHLTSLLQDIHESIPDHDIKQNNIPLPTEIRDIIKDKRQTRNRWRKTRDPHLKSRYNFLKKKLT